MTYQLPTFVGTVPPRDMLLWSGRSKLAWSYVWVRLDLAAPTAQAVLRPVVAGLVQYYDRVYLEHRTPQ